MSSARSRSSDPVGTALAAAVRTTADAVARLETASPVVLIDGRSGAGKSAMAQALVAQWPGRGRAQLVALDSLYPGWDGLADGTETARELILAPHARGVAGVWRRWDWDASVYAEAYEVDPSLPLIVEGSGILTPATAPLGEVRVWLESPEASRRDRALNRDGELYRAHWARWALQEERHLERDTPAAFATHVFAIP